MKRNFVGRVIRIIFCQLYLSACLAVFLVTNSSAVESLALTGYFESQFAGENTNSFQFLNWSKFQLGLEATIHEQVYLEGNVLFWSYQGQSAKFLEDYVPPQFDHEASFAEPIPFSDRYYLNNAFAIITFTGGSFTIGKQPLMQGIGTFWNPTDVLIEKDPFDRHYEKEGINALRLETSLSSLFSGTMTLSPEDSWENSFRQVSIRCSTEHFSTKIHFGRSSFERFAKETETKSWPYVSGELLYYQDKWSLWAEAIAPFADGSADMEQWLSGLSVRIVPRLEVSLEYFRNDWGRSSIDTYRFVDWSRAFYSYQTPLGQDYIALRGTLTDKKESIFSFEGVVIVNLNDRSWAASPHFHFQIHKRVNLTLAAILPTGTYNSEFGVHPEEVWFRLNYMIK